MNPSQLNILICSTSIANYDRRIQRIAKSLVKVGHQVSWISRINPGADLQNIKHKKLNPLVKSGFLFYAFFNLRLFFKLLFSKYDIIYSVDLDTVLPCYLIAKLRRKTIVFDAHEYFTEVPELLNKKTVKKVWVSIANFCLPKIKNNITVGPQLSKIFTERYHQPYQVVRNIGPKKDQLMIKNRDKNKMVYLGVINKGRGLELAIESLPELKNKTLKIIGDGDLLEDMKELAKKLGVENRVDFRGYVHPKLIDKELEDCYLALNMLLPLSKSYYYSLANKFFDYIHVGIPTINMAFPEYLDLAQTYKTGLLVDQYKVEDLILAVNKMDDPNLYNELQKGINKAILDLNWQTEEQNLLKIIDTLQ